MFDYQLIRSNRKSIAIQIDPSGRVTVRAPQRLPQAMIDAFVTEKSEWIREKQGELHRYTERCGRPPGGAHRFVAGEKFLYFGQAYPLQISDRQTSALRFNEGFHLRKSDQPRGAVLVETWYRSQARAYFTSRLQDLARQHGFRYARLRLSSARTRWGSCSSLGTISLNWRLIMAPPAAIDYVILHELAHLKEKNHSARFWTLLDELCPEYKIQRQWLKKNGECLSWP